MTGSLEQSSGCGRRTTFGDAVLPRVLFVTDAAPDAKHGGSVWLADLYAMLPPDRVAVCVLAREVSWPASLADVAHCHIPPLPEGGLDALSGRLRHATRRGYEWLQRALHADSVVQRVADFARRQAVDVVFVTLTGPTCLTVARRIGRVLRRPMISLVWDPPDYFLEHAFQLRAGARAPYLRYFDEAMRASTACVVMTAAMQRVYEERYGTRAVVMCHGIPRHLWQADREGSGGEDEYVIAYAGSLYAKEEWQALLAALDSVQWTVGGKPVRIRMYGAHFDRMYAPVPRRIEMCGWHDLESTVREVSKADAAYLPYWLDDQHRVVTRLSFPTKLSTYVAAGCPVLYHGPEDSSPTAFVREFGIGASCHSLAVTDILSALERVLQPAARDAVRCGARRALEEELGLHIFRRRFARLLDVPEHELRDVA
jgi:hypothetical protein